MHTTVLMHRARRHRRRLAPRLSPRQRARLVDRPRGGRGAALTFATGTPPAVLTVLWVAVGVFAALLDREAAARARS